MVTVLPLMKLLLASNSPRRRELLALLDIDYQIIEPKDVEEIYPIGVPVEEVASFLSALKADAYVGLPKESEVVVTADTVVICDGHVLGKPDDTEQAFKMLSMLSGRTHKVVTGVTLMSEHRRITFSESTLVSFDALSVDEINHYIKCYHPFDKAGAYGIQEWIGCIGIRRIEGCFYNVMGLPLHSLYHHLSRIF